MSESGVRHGRDGVAEREAAELGLESCTLRGAGHHADRHGVRGREVGETRGRPVLARELVEDVNGVSDAGEAEADGLGGGAEGDEGPIGEAAGDDDAHVGDAVGDLDAGFDPVLGINEEHEAGLVVEDAVLAADGDFRGEVAGALFEEEMAVVADEAVVGMAPEIGAVAGGEGEAFGVLVPARGWVEPLHGGMLGLTGGDVKWRSWRRAGRSRRA